MEKLSMPNKPAVVVHSKIKPAELFSNLHKVGTMDKREYGCYETSDPSFSNTSSWKWHNRSAFLTWTLTSLSFVMWHWGINDMQPALLNKCLNVVYLFFKP